MDYCKVMPFIFLVGCSPSGDSPSDSTFRRHRPDAVADLPQVQAVNGTGFTLKNDGRIIIFHGVNEMNKQFPYTPSSIGFDDRHAEFIKDHGFNLVRLGVFWAAIEPDPQQPGEDPVYDDTYLADIGSTIRMLADHGIYTFIDFHQDAYSNAPDDSGRTVGMGEPTWTDSYKKPHMNVGFPINLFGGALFEERIPWIDEHLDENYDGFWQNMTVPDNRPVQDAYAQMVQHTVNILKGTSGLIGYEIMNEPFPGSLWPGCTSTFDELTGISTSYAVGCSVFENESGALTSLYRKVIPAINAADPDALVLFEPVVFVEGDSPVKLPEFDGNNLVFSYHDYNGKNPDVPFQSANAYAAANGNLPQIMSEFGGIERPRLVNTIVNLVDRGALSWTYWAYSNNPIFKFVEGLPNPIKQGLVYDLREPLDDLDNVNFERLFILTRPYPQLIAGIQPTFGIHHRVFELSFLSVSSDGQTQIFVPHSFCPIAGCTMKVTGPATSSGISNQIALITNTGPGAVQVEIRPRL